MAFDYKKEYKEYYMPKNTPQIVQVTKMNFLAVRGVGDPNEKGGAYQDAIGLLYGIAFTIKMSKKGSHKIDGYFDYVVPPHRCKCRNVFPPVHTSLSTSGAAPHHCRWRQH